MIRQTAGARITARRSPERTTREHAWGVSDAITLAEEDATDTPAETFEQAMKRGGPA
jgi:hypothetical protein